VTDAVSVLALCLVWAFAFPAVVRGVGWLNRFQAALPGRNRNPGDGCRTPGTQRAPVRRRVTRTTRDETRGHVRCKESHRATRNLWRDDKFPARQNAGIPPGSRAWLPVGPRRAQRLSVCFSPWFLARLVSGRCGAGNVDQQATQACSGPYRQPPARGVERRRPSRLIPPRRRRITPPPPWKGPTPRLSFHGIPTSSIPAGTPRA